jgi:hypothetical protein
MNGERAPILATFGSLLTTTDQDSGRGRAGMSRVAVRVWAGSARSWCAVAREGPRRSTLQSEWNGDWAGGADLGKLWFAAHRN